MGRTRDCELSDIKKCCKIKCCYSCTYCSRAAPKERHKSCFYKPKSAIKICEQCFLCRSVVFCKTCTKYPICCTKSACRGQTKPILGNLGSPGGRTQSSTNVERRVFPTLLNQTKFGKITDNHQLLCTSPQEPLSVGGIASADKQKCSRVGQKSRFPGVLQQTISGPNTRQQMETYVRPKQSQKFLKAEKFKMETPETIRTSLQAGEWVMSIHFKDAYFHIPIQNQSRKYLRFHVQDKTYQFKALPYGLSSAPLEFTVVAKEVKLMASQWGIRLHQYLDNWLVWVKSHQTCLQHTQTLVTLCQDPRWLVNLEKSELDPKQVFDIVTYQFGLKEGKVRPTQDPWQTLRTKIRDLLAGPTCPVRQLMSLIGLLTATEKQVHLGRLHMRPIQWHLKQNWRVPESLEKVIPVPRSLHPHLRWWLEEGNVLQGQLLHPLKCALQLFTDSSKEGWGAHLNDHTYSLPESKLHINFLELKAVFLALKELKDLCKSNIVLIATDNITVVAYINKEGGGGGGGDKIRPSVCPSVENPDLVYQKAGYPQSLTHPRSAERGSRQVIQIRPDSSNRVISPARSFPGNMPQWHRPQIDHFIALIHPIQWTIAYPVGADRPAKRQKKTSCVSTGQAGPVLCTRQVACSTSFLSRQRDVIASFSFGACLCARNIFIRSLSSVFHCYW